VTAVWTLVLASLVALAYYGMWRGWQRRVRRTSAALPDLPVPPAADRRGALVLEAEGTYVSTTTQDDWLDRVAAHGLGGRSTGFLAVHETGLLYRHGAAARLWVPRDALVAVRDERAQAGKVLPGGGIVLVTWQRAGSRFDTGFAPRRTSDRDALLRCVADLLERTAC
jgi:hypothetical protein